VRRYMIGLIGSSHASESGLAMAQEVGERIARAGAVLVCGGHGGVMQAASQGCSETGGDVLGVLPGPTTQECNPFVTLAVPTNMGHARNVIIAHTAEVLIAVEGEYGTLSEAAIALKLGKRVLTLGKGLLLPGTEPMSTPQDAVESALQSVRSSRGSDLCPPD
jgi:uncharacterized protein (TIGR00725 family)